VGSFVSIKLVSLYHFFIEVPLPS